jgi:hypothetical protein
MVIVYDNDYNLGHKSLRMVTLSNQDVQIC